MKHQLDATLCRFYFCRVTLHVSGASVHHHEYLKLVQRQALIRRCDDWSATITHVPVAAVLVLNTPDDGRLSPKHVEWPCRNKTCTVLHQVGVFIWLRLSQVQISSQNISQQPEILIVLYLSLSNYSITRRYTIWVTESVFKQNAKNCNFIIIIIIMNKVRKQRKLVRSITS